VRVLRHSPKPREAKAIVENLHRLMTEENISHKRKGAGLLQLWLFLCLSAASSWTIWLWPTQQRSVYLFLFGWRVDWSFANLKLVIGNCLPGIIALVFSLTQGKRQLRKMLSTLVAWRTQLRWYILSLALPSGVFMASLFLVFIFFPMEISQPPITVLFVSLLTVPFGPVWEEIAWRAFALRKLQDHYSRLLSALIIGVYWGLWHIPLWLTTLPYLTITLVLIMCLNLVSWSVIFAFLYDRSAQSLPVVILLHATYVAVQNQVFAIVSYRNIQLIPFSAAFSVCLAATLARRLGAGNVVAGPYMFTIDVNGKTTVVDRPKPKEHAESEVVDPRTGASNKPKP